MQAFAPADAGNGFNRKSLANKLEGLKMKYAEVLGIIADWSAILTAAIAVLAFGKFELERRQRMSALERYLRNEKLSGHDQGQRSVIHLMSRLSLSEGEILSAAFRSSKISCVTSVDAQGRADAIMFEYDGRDIPLPKKL